MSLIGAENIVLKAVNPQGFKLQGTIDMHDLHIKVENRKGSVRSGTDPGGKKWSIKMTYPYGYISRTKAADDEHVDCYVGDNRKSKKVFVIHQVVPSTGKYDEDKCMLGFNTAAEAKKAYLIHYDSPKFFGSMTTMTIDELKESLKKNKGMKLSKAIDIVLTESFHKGKKVPVGTISGGYKKVSEGKWQKVKSGKKNSGNKLNVAMIPVKEARAHAEAAFKKAGMDLNKLIPNFDKNYKSIQIALKGSLDIKRADMPVVTQANIGKFKEELKSSKVKVESKKVSVSDLKPIQSEIWLDKLILNIVKFGMPNKKDSPVLSQITISSKTGHIADGHHRYGQAMLVDPNLKMDSLEVDMDIKKLLKVAKAFGVKQGTASRK